MCKTRRNKFEHEYNKRNDTLNENTRTARANSSNVLNVIRWNNKVDEFKDIRVNINLIDLSNRRIANLHIIVAQIRDLMLINQGIYGPIDEKMDERI